LEKLYPLPIVEVNGFLYIKKPDDTNYYIYVEDSSDVLDLTPNNQKVWELEGE